MILFQSLLLKRWISYLSLIFLVKSMRHSFGTHLLQFAAAERARIEKDALLYKCDAYFECIEMFQVEFISKTNGCFGAIHKRVRY